MSLQDVRNLAFGADEVTLGVLKHHPSLRGDYNNEPMLNRTVTSQNVRCAGSDLVVSPQPSAGRLNLTGVLISNIFPGRVESWIRSELMDQHS